MAGAISKSRHIHYKSNKKDISEEQQNHLKCSDRDGFKLNQGQQKWQEKLCCSPSQKPFRYYGDWKNINIFWDTKWHKISVKKSTLREVYYKSLWIFYSNQTEMTESSPELWFWIWQDNWKERKGTTRKDKIILVL